LKPKVLVESQIPEEAEALIAQYCDIYKWDKHEPMPRELLLEKMSDIDGLLTSSTKIDDHFLDHAKQLKVVSSISVGYNHFDLKAMKTRGIMGTHTPNVLNETVADLAFTLILSTARRVTELDQYIRQGQWQKSDNESLFGIDVHHAKLGIIGMGRIGEAIARRGKFGFGMDVVYYNRNRKLETEASLRVEYCPLDELLSTADFIVLMTPLTKKTVKLIGKREFGLMKPTAIFINVSRGQTVDEAALVDVLENGGIRAAGLDVFEEEPINADHPLLKLKNVVVLPHIGSATHQTRFDMAMLAARNLTDALTGQTPPNLIEELK
jgi:gluconate 2-dehydrogenase